MGVSSLLSVCRANLCPLEASCTLIEKTERFPAYTWIHSPALSYAEPCSTVLSPQLVIAGSSSPETWTVYRTSFSSGSCRTYPRLSCCRSGWCADDGATPYWRRLCGSTAICGGQMMMLVMIMKGFSHASIRMSTRGLYAPSFDLCQRLAASTCT
ncbi:uncharacterized protein LOC117654308 isoform X2 [Thrips palmi]|uniref:Uncharacterized protein LOC117654308 isoform X2 n=1 Tax=Thrips palmi TaxID=161013 RepID=A0A6P9AEN8_THRPL|nr:uncharacterized protein LOC117654308 isoform X2 [Thrips palmi]